MHQQNIANAGASDVEWVADLIGEAFQPLDATAWLVPDPGARARVLSRNFAIFVEHALRYGEVDVLADRTAAALWLPVRDDVEPPAPDDYERRQREACGEWTDNFVVLDALFAANHPHGSHDHLAFLAVRPDVQGQGRGSELLRHHHRALDATGQAAFLEASSTGSRDLYRRHGYAELGEAYALPNGALFWPMWREPLS